MQESTMTFKKLPEEKKRSVRVPIMFTQKEIETVRDSAKIRCLFVADFVRRAALGRKADVRYEHQIILELRVVVDAIRKIHAEYVAQGIEPPEHELKVVIQEAVQAMLRISK